jgi:hypothetical protein
MLGGSAISSEAFYEFAVVAFRSRVGAEQRGASAGGRRRRPQGRRSRDDVQGNEQDDEGEPARKVLVCLNRSGWFAEP